MYTNETLFYFPQFFLFFLFLPIFLLGQWLLYRYRKRLIAQFNAFPQVSKLIHPRSPQLQLIKTMGWIFIFSLLCLVCMDPFGNVRYNETFLSSGKVNQEIPQAILFLIDTSASMSVLDGINGESRLETAKKIMDDLIRNTHGQFVSLYAFTSELTPLVPLTMDYIFTRLSIQNLQINEGDVGGTLFEPTLKALKEKILAHRSPLQLSVILLSDGGDNTIETLQGPEREKKIQEIVQSFSNQKINNLQFYSIGIGSKEKQLIPHVTFENQAVYSKLEPEILQELATSNKFYFETTNRTTWSIAREISQQIEKLMTNTQLDAHQKSPSALAKESVRVDLYYQIPLGVALVFYALFLLLPDAFRGRE